MKLLRFFLIIFFSFIFWAKAEDITDFKIEGISLEDSLLNFFDENLITTSKRDFYKDDEFLVSLLPTLKSDSIYEYIQVHYKKNDNEYIVKSIDGMIDVDIQKCLKMQREVVDNISVIFSSTKKNGPSKIKHSADATGKSTTTQYEWRFNKGYIQVVCYDFVEPMIYPDGLNVSIVSKDVTKWLNTKAYK